jgi:hypothetical protein
MLKKGLLFCVTLVSLGLLDLTTTLLGTTYCGASEANPVLAGITMATPWTFVCIKLLGITFTGLMFYKIGDAQVSGISPRSGVHFIQLTYSFALVFLTVVVTNNLLIVASLV